MPATEKPAAPAAEPATPTPTPPVETPPAADTPPADTRKTDPLWQSFMAGLGQASSEPPVAKPEPPKPSETVGTTWGERAFERGDADKLEPADEPPAEPATEPAAETPPVEPAPEPPPATPTPEPPKEDKIEVTKRPPIEKLIEKGVQKGLTAHEAAKKKEEPAAPPVDPYEAALDDTSKEELSFYRYAAEKDPQFKDYPAKFVSFLKKFDAYVEGKQKADPEWTFSDNDPDAQKFIRDNKPVIPVPTRRKLERAQITESVRNEIKTEVSKEFEEKVGKVEHETHLLKVQPVIQTITNEFSSRLADGLAKDNATEIGEVVSRAREVGWDKAVEEDPVFAPIVAQRYTRAVQLVQEYAALTNKAKPFDGENQLHLELANMVDDECQKFARDGKLEETTRDGRTFLPISTFNDVVNKDREKAKEYWTFSTEELLGRIGKRVHSEMEMDVKKASAALAKAGFKREKPAKSATPPPPLKKEQSKTDVAAPPVPPAQPHVSPKSTVSAAPGPAKTTPKTEAPMFNPNFQKALNMPKVGA